MVAKERPQGNGGAPLQLIVQQRICLRLQICGANLVGLAGERLFDILARKVAAHPTGKIGQMQVAGAGDTIPAGERKVIIQEDGCHAAFRDSADKVEGKLSVNRVKDADHHPRLRIPPPRRRHLPAMPTV